MEGRVALWHQNPKHMSLRFVYNLDASSIVFDLGGYEGQWASDIYSRYCCTVHVFEPVQAYADNIRNRFARNPRIQVHPFGLGSSDTEIRIGMGNDGSSVFKEAGQAVIGRLVEAKMFLDQHSIVEIDLMKINIEGGEYDLLSHFLDTGVAAQVKNIQVQFHDFVPDAEAKMKGIQERLSVTHSLTYQYEFVWENWMLKEAKA